MQLNNYGKEQPTGTKTKKPVQIRALRIYENIQKIQMTKDQEVICKLKKSTKTLTVLKNYANIIHLQYDNPRNHAILHTYT